MTSMRLLYSAAAPLGADLVETVRKRLKGVGANVIVGQGASVPQPLCASCSPTFYHGILAYGLTESTTTITVLHTDDANSRFGSVGRVIPNLEVRLIRKDEGEVSVGHVLPLLLADRSFAPGLGCR